MKIRLPDIMKVITGSERIITHSPSLEKDDVRVNAFTENGILKITAIADATPLRYVMLRWNFKESEKRSDSVRVLGDTIERGYGDIMWRPVIPERFMMWTCSVSNGSDLNRDFSGRFTECFGVKVRPNALVTWQYDANGVTLWADVRCGGEGVVLSGREITLCEVVFGEYRDISAFDACKRYYKTLCDDMLPVSGTIYGSNNWYYAYGDSSHEEILADADILASCTKGLKNRPYMVIDDGWQKNGCDAPWNEFRDTFPDMKRLADEIAAKDVIPGIWVRYLIDKAHELNTPKEWRSAIDERCLDASHPDVLEYVKKVTREITSWGYKLIKHDYSTFDIIGYDVLKREEEHNVKDGWHFYDVSKTSAEIIKNFYKTIYDAAEGKAYILGCNVMGHLSAGYCHANRTGDDTSGFNWERTRIMGVNTLAFRGLHNGSFYVADADCVGITEHISWERNREWLRALSMSGSVLFVSCKPGFLTESQYDEVKEAFRINSEQKDEFVPLDWMESSCPERYLVNGREERFNFLGDIGADVFESGTSLNI